MRIAFPTQPWAWPYPPSESIAIWSYEVGKRLAGEHEVVIWARDREGGSGSQALDGIEVRTFRGRGDHRATTLLERTRPRPFASPLYYPAYHAALARDARRLRPDVIHIHNFSQLVPLLHRASPRSSLVLHMHCEWLNQLPRKTIRRRLRHADAIVGCTDYIAERAVAAFPELRDRIHTIYEGVAPEQFSPGEARSGPPRLLAVSRISPEKGTHVLFEAFGRLAAERPDLELEVLGVEALPPPEMLAELDDDPRVRELLPFYRQGGYLEELKRRLPADALRRVTLRGFVPHDEAPVRFREADLLVFPSIWAEPFGMPTAEAMAAGLPVVVSDWDGYRDTVRHEVDGFRIRTFAPGAGMGDGLAHAHEAGTLNYDRYCWAAGVS
ncbi:MAG TPA: glycosyltransferase family 4 protein, partial [Gaiellaceae bacterium]|nr:glycosyltransferase family 4 protein [Gaiellaceae bacterium]